MKAILRGFELVSGLKVNFWKSCLVGVIVEADFLVMVSRFLNCRIRRAPFNYLGLSVGANPRSFATWQPMLYVLKNQLNSWGNKYVSFGGRLVLLLILYEDAGESLEGGGEDSKEVLVGSY
jgi:hypothetical protein